MKKYFSLFTLSILFILLSITVANAENLITNEEEEIVEIEIYDENDNLVKVIKQAAGTQSENFTSLSSMRFYNFGETIFSNYVWIKNGGTFHMPDLVDAEVPKAFPGPWGVKVYTAGGTYKGKAIVRDIFNWASFPLDYFTSSGGYYKLQFVNEGSGTITLKHGTVRYYN